MVILKKFKNRDTLSTIQINYTPNFEHINKRNKDNNNDLKNFK